MIQDTPRTDAHNWKDGDYDDPLHAFYDFACTLERELNATNAEIERLTNKVAQLYEGAEESKQRIKRLEEAGDALAKTQTYDLLETVNWLKAKEAKL
jgi:septal ring factor EnvC (AmiA/AmiB activator)